MIESLIFLTNSSEDTQEAGEKIAAFLQPKDVVCLTGDLGSGKTTLMKGISYALAGIQPEEVTSPTFTYLHIYSGSQKIYHFDLYRLSSSLQFIDLGFHEFLSKDGICCIEWPNKIPEHLNLQRVLIDISYSSSEGRTITFRRIHGTS